MKDYNNVLKLSEEERIQLISLVEKYSVEEIERALHQITKSKS